VLVIGGFGGFAFMNIIWYNLAASRLSWLTALYTIIVMINSIGGWFYYHRRGISVGAGSLESLFGSGHFLMHLYSLVASAVYTFTLVSWICFQANYSWDTQQPAREMTLVWATILEVYEDILHGYHTYWKWNKSCNKLHC
jgi:hypothetical protein